MWLQVELCELCSSWPGPCTVLPPVARPTVRFLLLFNAVPFVGHRCSSYPSPVPVSQVFDYVEPWRTIPWKTCVDVIPLSGLHLLGQCLWLDLCDRSKLTSFCLSRLSMTASNLLRAASSLIASDHLDQNASAKIWKACSAWSPRSSLPLSGLLPPSWVSRCPRGLESLIPQTVSLPSLGILGPHLSATSPGPSSMAPEWGLPSQPAAWPNVSPHPAAQRAGAPLGQLTSRCPAACRQRRGHHRQHCPAAPPPSTTRIPLPSGAPEPITMGVRKHLHDKSWAH